MSQNATLYLGAMIARAARYDGPSLSIGPSDSSLPRVEVRNGWHMVHLAHLPAIRSLTDRQRDGPEIYYVEGGSIFGKATKVAKTCYTNTIAFLYFSILQSFYIFFVI